MYQNIAELLNKTMEINYLINFLNIAARNFQMPM